MSYKQKLDEAQHKAHYQNIATKILRDLTDLRNKSETSATIPRRWVWELIQNAKDVYGTNGVKIKIDFKFSKDKKTLSFSHNGKPFTADNIRFLIEQVSTKDRKKQDESKPKTTGKFGTGFLTTHLLSDIVNVEGVAKEPDLEYRKFNLMLDRTGSDIDEITQAVKTAKDSMSDLDLEPIFSDYAEGEFNTTFRYNLLDELGLNVAQAGLADLETSLPYCLDFVPEIDSIEILPNKKFQRAENFLHDLGEGIELMYTKLIVNGQELYYPAVRISSGDTTLLIPVLAEGDKITLVKIAENIPRLFCDFPLLGTEDFSFPTIINNPRFNPTDPRDGIFLNSPQRAPELSNENKKIIEEAVQLYFSLLDFASKNNWKNLHVLADFNFSPVSSDVIDSAWFKHKVLDPIKDKLLGSKIVYTANGTLEQIHEDGKNKVLFPFSTKREIRDAIWQSGQFWFPYGIPRKEDVELWYNLRWSQFGKLDTTRFAEILSYRKCTDALSKLVNGIDVYKWLNQFYSLLKTEDSAYDSIINRFAIFPNQNNDFCLLGNLSVQADEISDELKDILKLLGKDIRVLLLEQRIENNELLKKFYFKSDIVRQITAEVIEKSANREIAKKFLPAFKKLLQWINDNTEEAVELFPKIYEEKHLLYDDEEIMANITKAEELTNLFTEFKVSSIQELKERIQAGDDGTNKLLPVTQEILMSMGITNLAEWQEALKDKNLAELFSHKSTPTEDMFVYAQSLIANAKAAIKAYLATDNDYDISHAQDTAPTIIAGVLKNKEPISIVVRPSYNHEVIIYYASEIAVLEYENSELWVYNGSEVEKITLGHILKMAKIKKFPI